MSDETSSRPATAALTDKSNIQVQPARDDSKSPKASPRSKRKASGKKDKDGERQHSARSPRNGRQTETCPFIDFGCEFKDDRAGVKSHLRHNQTFDPHLHQLRTGVIDFRDDIDAFNVYFERHDRLIEDLVFRVGQLDCKYNAHLVWRIDNFAFHFKEARLEREPAVFSHPFYTGRYGYKLAASLTPFGDGDVKGEYVGVFLSILQGEHDALCQWPFPCPIKFTMIEQRNDQTRKDVIQTLKPNSIKKNRPFIGRPLGDRNPSFGIQKFIALSELRHRDYVKDDVMFIRIDIDTRDLIKH